MDDESALSGEELRHTLRDATEHLARTLDLLDRLLRHPVPDAAQGPVSIAGTLRLVRDLFRMNRLSVRLDIDGALTASLPAVAGVEQHIEHALLALLLNALEALGPDEGGTVRLTASVAAGHVEVAMEDSGPGVSTEIRSRLFQPFVTSKSGRPAAGLGLAVSRWLLRQSGGDLVYAPTNSAGSRFVLRLPVWPGGSAPPQSAA